LFTKISTQVHQGTVIFPLDGVPGLSDFRKV
jgi:hypothetical protein